MDVCVQGVNATGIFESDFTVQVTVHLTLMPGSASQLSDYINFYTT